MKKHIILCTALLALMATSCVKTPQIYRLLTKEELEIVPYQFGQLIKMVDQDNDTIPLAVIRDELRLGYEDAFYHPGKMKPNIPPYCYERFIQLTSPADDSCLMHFVVGPDKQLIIAWKYNQCDGAVYYDLPNMPTETLTLNDITYQDVYRKEFYYGNDSIQQVIFYNEEFGLLAVKRGEMSLIRVP